MALGVIPGAPSSKAKAFVDLEADLDEKKVTRVTAQIEADVLSRVVRDLKFFADMFAIQIPTLEDKVKHLEDKVAEGLNKIRAWELCLEHITRANDDYQTQDAWLTKKLESKFPA
jgi:hypothetical protein